MIAAAQNFMRVELRSESAVSQRDIIRVVRLLRFFRQNSFSAPEANERCRMARALLLALGVSFYLGLNSWQRALFSDRVTARHYGDILSEETQHSLDLPKVLTEEMDAYMSHIQLPAGIALTRALKENIFAVIIGIQCNIPVMIVGMPGTGKTLAVNIATDVLRGSGAVPFFRGFCDVANSVFRYQCSKDSTSTQIHEAALLAFKTEHVLIAAYASWYIPSVVHLVLMLLLQLLTFMVQQVFESAVRAKQRIDAEDECLTSVVCLPKMPMPALPPPAPAPEMAPSPAQSAAAAAAAGAGAQPAIA